MKRETERDALYDKQKGKLREKALRRIHAVTHIYSLIQSVCLLESQHTHVKGAARFVHTLLLEGGKRLWSHWNVK